MGWNQLVNSAILPSTATVNGVTFTNNGDGSITANGTATANTTVQLVGAMAVISGHKYVLKGCPSGGSTTTYSIATSGASDIGNGAIIANTSATRYVWIGITNGTTVNNLVFRPNIIDLTTLLGSTIADYAYTLEQATAGSGIAWLKSFGFLSKSYYPYCEPTLESVQATERVARGINQWDEEWVNGFFNDNGVFTSRNDIVGSKNAIRVMPNTTYYFNAPITGMFVTYWRSAVSTTSADATQLISRYQVPNTKIFTTPTDCQYIHFNMPSAYGSTYLNNVCINLSNPTINGQYFPYESHTYPLGDVTLRGIPKLDSNNNIYYDGDKYKADGTVNRRFGVVDLGTLTWVYDSSPTYPLFRSDGITSTAKPVASHTDAANVRCAIYTTNSENYAYIGAATKCISMTTWGQIRIRDTAYTSVAAFKASLSGVYLVYELATPTTETTSSFTPIQYTGSTESFSTDNDVPVGVDAKYYTDLTLPTLPTANGTYTLKCTVTDGTGIVSWVSE